METDYKIEYTHKKDLQALTIKKVCCQGVMGAYSHITAESLFPDSQAIFVPTFAGVFKAVQNGEVDAGIVPIENSTAGVVGEVMELLREYPLSIVFAGNLPIQHKLCALDGAGEEDIEKIYSHHQALMQCSEYLSKLKAEQIETANTAVSASMASTDKTSAAVCSAQAAKLYGLKILNENICNNNKNQTKFIVIIKDTIVLETSHLTSVYFTLKNSSGSLYSALKIFSELKVNLLSLHSLPLKEEMWNYGFYVELEGSIKDEKIIDALNILKKQSPLIKFLGSYSLSLVKN